MFTGLVETVGSLKGKIMSGGAGELQVEATFPSSDLALGDSVAVNGVCLTVTRFTERDIWFHTLAETLSRTNLGKLKKGQNVNLERALRLGDRLGGHVVSGHVDGTGRVLSIGKAGADMELQVELSPELAPYVVMKGSVAINGISLTVARLQEHSLGVCIIPHTWNHTNLCELKNGDLVNLETDLFGKYILRQRELEDRKDTSGGVTLEALMDAGFLG